MRAARVRVPRRELGLEGSERPCGKGTVRDGGSKGDFLGQSDMTLSLWLPGNPGEMV